MTDRDEAGRFLPGHSEAGPGRPTDYDEGYCSVVLERMGAGFSKTATAGFIGVSKQTFDTWTKKHPAFLDAVKIGETMRTLKLEGDLLDAADGPTVTSRIFALKNAAPEEWRDKREVDHQSSDGSMSPTETTARDIIASRLSRLSPASGENGDTGEPDGEPS